MVNGIVQLATGHPVVGAKISAETLSGKKLSLRRKIGATTDRGGYYLETAGLPKRFVVVAEGGRVQWQENGQTREQPLRGAMRAVVTLEHHAVLTTQTAMLSLGTTAEVAIYRRLGKKDLARAAELTRRALAWPGSTQLGFDDRVNDDFALGSKVREALRAHGGFKILVARIARQGVRGKTHLVPYGGDSLLAPSSQPAVVRLAARGSFASLSRVQPQELTAGNGGLGAWYNYCVPLAFDKDISLFEAQCAISVAVSLLSSLGGGGNQSQLQQLMVAMQADFEALQGQISDLQTSLNQDFAVLSADIYSGLQAVQTGDDIMQELQNLQMASTQSCEPPGTAVSPTNPPPCGALTYTLFGGPPPPQGQNMTLGLLGELNPENPAGFFQGDDPKGAVSFQAQIMGGVAGAQGALPIGQGVIWANMKAGGAYAPANQGTPTSLYTHTMSLALQTLELDWFTLMSNLATLNAQYYGYQQWPLVAQNVTDAASLQAAIQQLQQEIGVYLQQQGYLASSTSLGALAQQQQSWAQLIPPNAAIDPSTKLMWWNTTGTINADGTAVTTQPVANNAGCGYVENDWVNTVNGAETAGCSGWNPPQPQAGQKGSGPTCSSQTPTCTGEVHNNWVLPLLTYLYSDNVVITNNDGNCNPYSSSTAFGNIPGSGPVGASPGLFGSVSPSVGAGPTETSLANVAPGVFPNTGILIFSPISMCVKTPNCVTTNVPPPLGNNCSGTAGSTPYTVMLAQLSMNCSSAISASDCKNVCVSCQSGTGTGTASPYAPWYDSSTGMTPNLPNNNTGYLVNFSPNYILPAEIPNNGVTAQGLVVLTTSVNPLCYTWPLPVNPNPPQLPACPAQGWLPPAPAGAPTDFKPVYPVQDVIPVLQLTWNPPADTGGSAVSEYQLQYSSNPEATKPEWQSVSGITGTSYTVPPLAPCTPYTFRVRAVNASGVAGAAATTIAQYPPVPPSNTLIPPCQPFDLAAYPGNSQVQLSWLAPTFLGPSAPPQYVYYSEYIIQYSADNGASWTQVPGPICSTTATITGLVNGTDYEFRVAALSMLVSGESSCVNPEGQGVVWGLSGWSETVSATPEGPAFSAPTGITGEAGNGSVALSWSAPAYTGGGQITGYVVGYSADNGTNWTQVSRTVTGTFTVVNGLTNGTPYVFQIAAVNQFGVQGPWSDVSGPFIPFGPSPTPAPAP
jgi:hypothetical protein